MLPRRLLEMILEFYAEHYRTIIEATVVVLLLAAASRALLDTAHQARRWVYPDGVT
jgi:hypothetical protein